MLTIFLQVKNDDYERHCARDSGKMHSPLPEVKSLGSKTHDCIESAKKLRVTNRQNKKVQKLDQHKAIQYVSRIWT